MSVEYWMKRMQEERETKYLYDFLWVSAIMDIEYENKASVDIRHDRITNSKYCYVHYLPIKGRRESKKVFVYFCDSYEDNESWIIDFEKDVSREAKKLEIEPPIVYTINNCSHCGAPVEKNKTRCSYCHCDY